MRRSIPKAGTFKQIKVKGKTWKLIGVAEEMEIGKFLRYKREDGVERIVWERYARDRQSLRYQLLKSQSAFVIR